MSLCKTLVFSLVTLVFGLQSALAGDSPQEQRHDLMEEAGGGA